MLGDLFNLYVELTESHAVKITQENKSIEIRIVAKWFDNMSPAERQDYLREAIDAIYPELVQRFKINFVAYSPKEMN